MNDKLSYETALAIAIENDISLNDAINNTFVWIQRNRGNQLRFMISLWGLPWFLYMKHPHEAVPDLPAHAVQAISKAQPWDVGNTGLAIKPEPGEIYNTLKIWMATIYQDGINKYGSAQLPGEFNVTRGGGVMLFMGYTWWDRDGATIEKILDVMEDTNMTRVIWNYMQRLRHEENIPCPPWDKVRAIYNEYEYSKQRAEATERLLFPKEPMKKKKKNIKRRMQSDLIDGATGQILLDPETNTMSWILKNREQFNEVMREMGMNDSQQEESPYYLLWYSIGDAIKEDNLPEALILIDELQTQLKEQAL